MLRIINKILSLYDYEITKKTTTVVRLEIRIDNTKRKNDVEKIVSTYTNLFTTK